jgi:hypothetical protein
VKITNAEACLCLSLVRYRISCVSVCIKYLYIRMYCRKSRPQLPAGPELSPCIKSKKIMVGVSQIPPPTTSAIGLLSRCISHIPLLRNSFSSGPRLKITFSVRSLKHDRIYSFFFSRNRCCVHERCSALSFSLVLSVRLPPFRQRL